MLPLVTRTSISPEGAAAVGAAKENSVVEAASPNADNLRKVRLLCSFDTEFSWQDDDVVGIVRKISNCTGAMMIGKCKHATWYALSLLISIRLISLCAAGQMNSLPATPSGWSLVWSDDFNGSDGVTVDSSKWVLESGGNGWGNQELEYYTSRPQNAFLHDGNLVIKVLEEKHTGSDGVNRNYTSAR